MGQTGERSEIVFFDVETTIPTCAGQGYALLEFGAMLVCPEKLKELHAYSTLIRPANPSLISPASVRCNGITREAVASAPTFADIADTVYELLHERVWAGHNILRFDCLRIREAFTEINRPPPSPKSTIDSLPLLTQTFGRRAGNMKMATLATYFGLGQQTHRSLDDVRMNLEVIKHCATVLFLESCLPDVLKSRVSPKVAARSCSVGKSLQDNGLSDMETESILLVSPIATQCNEEKRPTTSSPIAESSKLANPVHYPQPQTTSPAALSEATWSSSRDFAVLKPHEVLISSLTTTLFTSHHGSKRIQLLHNGFPFQLSCADLRIRFGISGRFCDKAGRPKLNIVIDASQSLCEVLEACDSISLCSFLDSGSSSEWKPVLITRKEGSFNHPTVRLQIPVSLCMGNTAILAAEVYKKESVSGTVQSLRFNKVDIRELGSLLMPGNLVDAIFCLDQYEYQQSAGIRLTEKLGAWNLVQRSKGKKWGNNAKSGVRSNCQEMNLQSKTQLTQNREKRGDVKLDSLNKKETNKGGLNTNGQLFVGREFHNNFKWVPVDAAKSMENKASKYGKENIPPKGKKGSR
ncbi:protein NEN1-like [Neltuma alba]|uniref:protein NEN1-like n=1 Tax=Neltuma alba TaxID=207710 RepID=UPI0010A3DA8B|nr:protein NEN1-like [Prosopis alba]